MTNTRQSIGLCRVFFIKVIILCGKGIEAFMWNWYTTLKYPIWGEKRGCMSVKKRVLSLMAALVLMLGLIPAASAAQPDLVVTMRYNSPWCVIGGETTTVDPANDQVVPVAEK